MTIGIEVMPLGPVAVGARAFRLKGRAFLTAIVKATFSLRQDAPFELAKPRPITITEQPRLDGPISSVRHASDLALVVPRPEILLDAIAFAAPGAPVGQVTTRLAVARGTTMILSKQLDVYGDRRAAPGAQVPSPAPFERMEMSYERALGGLGRRENPAGVGVQPDGDGKITLPSVVPADGAQGVAPAGYGPISSAWPLRRALRGSLSRDELDLAIFADLRPDFDDAYFQSAPIDQQVDEWRSGDMIALTNLHPEFRILRVHLPALRGIALAETSPGRRTPLPLRADTIFIEPHMLRAEILYRGVTPMTLEDLNGIRVAGAIEEMNSAFEWPRLSDHRGLVSVQRAGPARQIDLASTAVLDDGAAAPAVAKKDLSTTLVIDEPAPKKAKPARRSAPKPTRVAEMGTLIMEPGGDEPESAPPSVTRTGVARPDEQPASMPFARRTKRSRSSSKQPALNAGSGTPWTTSAAPPATPAQPDALSTLVLEADPPPSPARPPIVAAEVPPPAAVQPGDVSKEPLPFPKAAWGREPSAPNEASLPRASPQQEPPLIPKDRKPDADDPMYKKFKR